MSKQNYTVARVVTHNRDNIGKFERHIERKNDNYANMNVDEINLAASDKYGYPVYHYHLHIVALPVVQKEIKWSKRCKDKSLVGTVKEVVNQISHSKKWRSEPMIDENGKTVLVPSYSLLQDKFFEYMQNAGFTDFVRGERDSTRENLSVLQYQIGKDKERLKDIQKKIEIIEPAEIEYKKIDEIGKKTFTGKVQMSNDDYDKLTTLAKEAISCRTDIQYYKDLVYSMQRQIDDLQYKFNKLKQLCRPYAEAIRIAPEKVKKFIDDILVKAREKAKTEKDKGEISYPPTRRKPKMKSREDFER